MEAAYRRHHAPLLRLAMLMTGSRHDAEDIVHAVFASASPRWDDIEDPAAYLRRAVVNTVNDHHRRRYRARRFTAFFDAEPVVLPPETDDTWVELRQLPPTQRAVVVLRFYEDLPLTQIADLLGRPAATVRSDLHRALKTLQRTLPGPTHTTPGKDRP
ncbi:RNA polymerase sigma factor [Kineococcus gynurae]|uniref:RNA polymerase sigma factor n=1 Tax=Kineococcus gynurae TaxID=452979 RepID=UPI0035E90D5E